MSVQLEDLFTYLRDGPLGGNYNHAELESALLAESVAQLAVVREPYYGSPDLDEALCRRVACNLARRGLPLGVQMSEVSGTRIATHDPEIRRLEAPYRKLAVG